MGIQIILKIIIIIILLETRIRKKLYLDAKLNIIEMSKIFQSEHPELKYKVNYSFYYLQC